MPRARWAGILSPGGVRPHSSTLSPACCAADCCRRFCCRVPPFLLRVGWLCSALSVTPVFFDSLCARYAQRRILCARLGTFVCASHGAALSCGACCGGWGFPRVWVWGSSGVLLGCERGRVSVSLVFFFEDATMPERGGASMLHPGSPMGVIE